MKTMGLTRLLLVDPRCVVDDQAVARASGAEDVLEGIQYCADLDQSVAECVLVIGASARLRSLPWPVLDPRACAQRVAELGVEQEIAVVFGREKSGLSNRELERCNLLMHIPANPHYSSLNLAAAVQVLGYELWMQQVGSVHAPSPKDEPASAADIGRFYQHLEQVLVETGFLDPGNPRQVMRRLKRLFNRCDLEKTEVNILRGILTCVQSPRRSK